MRPALLGHGGSPEVVPGAGSLFPCVCDNLRREGGQASETLAKSDERNSFRSPALTHKLFL